ncbi:IclR family transcriptional regulator domain-containing protein [Actinoallomurus iriomotensis]|uniref:IclR family transcriptional regulator domain-containing protein n=1 Tax=Actinoallomurus iriomotensis TaxID=478107 RepID=UPI0025531BEB|nr:IclR family transcriptional regulator C-terminal domain-containing protein [Actinoallomurus iriomotensis]
MAVSEPTVERGPVDLQTSDDPAFVQSLERGLTVLRAFNAEQSRLTLSDVAKLTGLDRSVARRFLHTMVHRGYLRSDGQTFALHPRAMRIGTAYLSSLSFPKVAAPHLADLAAAVHESSSMSVLDGGEIVYVARIPTTRLITISTSVGTRLPAYATSMGRVLLAHRPDEWIDGYLASATLRPLTSHTVTDTRQLRAELRRVRDQGWALVDEELAYGLRSIAVPLHGPTGEVVAAVNTSTDVSRRSVDELRDDVLPHLRSAARLIETALASSRGKA